MPPTLSRRIAIAILAFPIAALADVSGTTTLEANTNLNLDTGATAATGGDLRWNGSTITPQGTARAFNVGPLGQNGFDNAVEATVRPLLVVATAAAIPANVLVVNDYFVVLTNGRNAAKVLVKAKSGTAITLQFVTFIAAVPTGPTITAIQNNSSRIPSGFPNYGIAPSSLFVVVGSGLSDPGDPVLQSSSGPGIPLTLNGTSITVVVSGVTTRPALYYTSPRQLAAVLPATTPVGTGTLTVTYRGATSAPATIQVVPSALGINTYNGNLGVATDAVTGALLTFTNPGAPGQIIVLWTSGLGADPEDSDTVLTSTPHAVNTPLQIYIGGVAAVILYQGSSGYPGVNQINLTIPQSAPTGCFVAVVAVTGTVVSNSVTLPISNGGGACVESLTGVNGNQVAGASVRTGLVSLIQTFRPGTGSTAGLSNTANAAFGRYTGLAGAAVGAIPSPGGCVATPVITAGGPIGFTGLDAGVITLTGPNGLAATLALQLGIRGVYNVLLGAGAIPQSGGTFTFKGAGGVDVGSFTSTVEFTNPLMNWTNQSASATVDKSQGLTVTWTGGNPGTYVVITGTSTNANQNPQGVTGGFTCLAPVAAGRFTVPSYILLALPSGPGAVILQNYVYSTLSADGLDVGLALGDISIQGPPATFR